MPLPDSRFEDQPGLAADGSVTLVLSGDLDLNTEAALAAQLRGVLAQRPRQVIFDLAGVGFADLSTLRALVTVHGDASDVLPPVLRHPPLVVIRLLEVSGLAEHCVIVP